MDTMLIPVSVKPGTFRTERLVSFDVEGRPYQLIVDESDVVGDDRLRVHVVEMSGDQALIDLPRDTFSSGSRIQVPKSILQPAWGTR
jgi:hypothetical protein